MKRKYSELFEGRVFFFKQLNTFMTMARSIIFIILFVCKIFCYLLASDDVVHFIKNLPEKSSGTRVIDKFAIIESGISRKFIKKQNLFVPSIIAHSLWRQNDNNFITATTTKITQYHLLNIIIIDNFHNKKQKKRHVIFLCLFSKVRFTKISRVPHKIGCFKYFI